MKILYFYQYFSTPAGAWGTRVYEFASQWVKAGHEVVVVSSIYSKSDLKAHKLIETQTINGITVKVLNILIDNRQSKLKRIWTFIQYLMLASWYALKIRADVVIASSGPITVGIPGLIARLRSRKMVFEVRDLWPEGAIFMKIIRNRWMIRFAYWFEKYCYKKARLIVTLSQGMSDNIKERFGYEKIITVPNAANLSLFSKEKPGKLPKFYKKKKVAIYTGNIGEVNNSILLLNAARQIQLKGIDDILILLIGEGQQKEMINEIIEKENLKTILIHDLVPKSDLVRFIQSSMVSLVPLKSSPLLDTSSPNKLFESLAAGVPVVQTTQGWIKDLIGEHDCGYTVSPVNPEELADLLISIKDQNDELKAKGVKGHKLACRYFDSEVLAKKMLNALEKLHHEA